MGTKRVILIVLDSVGIGELPDANQFGDRGSHTLGHIAAALPDLKLSHLRALGLANITDWGLPPVDAPRAAFGRAAEQSPGKDTITGHWEIAGLIPDITFPYFPEGFPRSIMAPFEAAIGRPTLGNYPASGTVIIQDLGEEHQRTGAPIVYTSSDSVFQVAMHEATIPLEEQYRICQIARDLLTGDNAIGRVIARPFIGTPSHYVRTPNRKDYALNPPGATVLNAIRAAGKKVYGVGKIKDIFNGSGISDNTKTKHNDDGIDQTLAWMAQDFSGLIFTNLVDFDMLYGHRRDVVGYGRCLEAFDRRLPEILAALRPDDTLLLTADHGNDPTFRGTDHTREYVPILAYGAGVRPGLNLGTRTSFADIGATIAGLLEVAPPPHGTGFHRELQSAEGVA
ncbi:MAG: phosphopentomutase [Bacteroidota bacterium]